MCQEGQAHVIGESPIYFYIYIYILKFQDFHWSEMVSGKQRRTSVPSEESGTRWFSLVSLRYEASHTGLIGKHRVLRAGFKEGFLSDILGERNDSIRLFKNLMHMDALWNLNSSLSKTLSSSSLAVVYFSWRSSPDIFPFHTHSLWQNWSWVSF